MKISGLAEFGGKDQVSDEVSDQRGDDHEDAHHENTGNQLRAQHAGSKRQGEKGNQRHTSYPVSFKTIGGWPDRVTGVVTGAIGDYARVLRIILRQLEDDFHQVRANVGNLGEDAAADAQ